MDPRNRPNQFGAGFLYRDDIRNPTAFVPQYLHVANKPSETNILNMTNRTVNVAQLPPLVQQPFTRRILSSYTILPIGARNQAPFGSS